MGGLRAASGRYIDVAAPGYGPVCRRTEDGNMSKKKRLEKCYVTVRESMKYLLKEMAP